VLMSKYVRRGPDGLGLWPPTPQMGDEAPVAVGT
jgi:hypothetical protein